MELTARGCIAPSSAYAPGVYTTIDFQLNLHCRATVLFSAQRLLKSKSGTITCSAFKNSPLSDSRPYDLMLNNLGHHDTSTSQVGSSTGALPFFAATYNKRTIAIRRSPDFNVDPL
jgi:hypothetical protein